MIPLTTTQLAALTHARVCEYERVVNELRGTDAKARSIEYEKFKRSVILAHRSLDPGALLRQAAMLEDQANRTVGPKAQSRLVNNANLIRRYTESFIPLLPYAFEAAGIRHGLIASIEGIDLKYRPHLALLKEDLSIQYVHLFCDRKAATDTCTLERIKLQLRLMCELMTAHQPDFRPTQLVGYLAHSGLKLAARSLSDQDRKRIRAVARHLSVIGLA